MVHCTRDFGRIGSWAVGIGQPQLENWALLRRFGERSARPEAAVDARENPGGPRTEAAAG